MSAIVEENFSEITGVCAVVDFLSPCSAFAQRKKRRENISQHTFFGDNARLIAFKTVLGSKISEICQLSDGKSVEIPAILDWAPIHAPIPIYQENFA